MSFFRSNHFKANHFASYHFGPTAAAVVPDTITVGGSGKAKVRRLPSERARQEIDDLLIIIQAIHLMRE